MKGRRGPVASAERDMEDRRSIQAMRIKELRGIRRLREADIAHWLGISEDRYRKYESGECDMSATELMMLAVFYGVTTDVLLGLSDDLAAAGCIQIKNHVDFLKRMFRLRMTNREAFDKFRAMISELGSESGTDEVDVAFSKYFQEDMAKIQAGRS